jgi:hypothetical protein
MALRRACAKFGIARYLWAKDEKPKSNQSPSNIFKTTPPREKGTISREEWLAKQEAKSIAGNPAGPLYADEMENRY